MIPSSIVIYNRDDMIFSNRKAGELFETFGNAKELDKQLKSLDLTLMSDLENSLSFGGIHKRNTFKLEEIHETSSNSISYYSPTKLFSEIDKINELASRKPDISEGLNSVSCYVGSMRKSDGSISYLDIKICWMHWGENFWKMVIINRNSLIDKVLEFKKDRFYRDRLIATVSHDLRTPLNGVTSILEICMDQLKQPGTSETCKM